jgi:hypothetical protein
MMLNDEGMAVSNGIGPKRTTKFCSGFSLASVVRRGCHLFTSLDHLIASSQALTFQYPEHCQCYIKKKGSRNSILDPFAYLFVQQELLSDLVHD